ncbi:hypothetical protein ACH5A3_21530 [Streptomyces echinatus]|uniref:hypothetical protein n=1 Tax=Streptomyces echinatus TaxID=67293 RepID=UPI0037BB3D9F
MTGPCQRPECGGATHTDGWGNPTRCPRACSHTLNGLAHDAHDGCPGWAPDDGTRPDQPPAATPLEEAKATIESLRYQIRHAREALGTDEPSGADAAIARVRALHRQESGLCAHCTGEYGVPYPCPTITALDGEMP